MRDDMRRAELAQSVELLLLEVDVEYGRAETDTRRSYISTIRKVLANIHRLLVDGETNGGDLRRAMRGTGQVLDETTFSRTTVGKKIPLVLDEVYAFGSPEGE